MMAKAKVVSFDIFDTALRRKLGSPRHLFYVMEAMLDATRAGGLFGCGHFRLASLLPVVTLPIIE